MPTPNLSLPAGIEIFRAGRRIDDAGVVHDFSDADIAAIAASYDPTLHEAPLTVGHPASDLPAYGWVAKLAGSNGVLRMDTANVDPQFSEMVSATRFKKRSAAFYPPRSPSNPTPGQWYLRHVAFLGAQPPAVLGLKDIKFSEGDAAGTVFFSENSTTSKEQSMDEETKQKLAEAEAKAQAAAAAQAKAEADAAAANAKLAQFAEAQRTERHTGHVNFAEAQVTAGKLLPMHKDTAVAVLDSLADSQPVEFSEGGATKKVAPAEWLKGLIAGASPVVQFGEFAPGNCAGESTKGLSDVEIDKRAKVYAVQHSVSYAEALGKIASFTA